MVDFVVCIENKSGNSIIVELTTNEGQINVNSMFTTNKGQDYIDNRLLTFSSVEYTGPIFESLEEVLQDKVYGWLETLGINEDLAVFIETASLEHEELLY